jgi:putative heme-binding domain-containing protein
MIPGALRLLLRQPLQHEADLILVSQLLVPQSAIENQLAAVNRLGDHPRAETAEMLLRGWSGYGPMLRSHVLDTLASRTAWSRRLLDEIATQRLSLAELDAAMRSRLIATSDETLRGDWERILSTSTTSDRRQVVADYEKSLTLGGDTTRGAKVFATRCASCHRVGEVGVDVGPNLLSITDKSPISLLTAILDPGAAVESRYVSYGILTDDGRIHNGLLVTETGSSLKLLSSEGKSVTILRSEIEEIRASGKSLMPDGLEKEISQQDMSDLLQFLRTAQTTDRLK